MSELWKDVLGYKHIYQVSSLGNVRSLDRIDSAGRKLKGKVLSLKKDSDGYRMVELYSQGVSRTAKVHRLVLETFKGPPESPYRSQCGHIDGKRDNNVPENLMWVSSGENHHHMIQHGNALSGEKSPRSKLTSADIKNIREASIRGAKKADLAIAHGVSRSHIYLIVKKKTWAHI